jgi:serine/threonine protein phosphatase PrpC
MLAWAQILGREAFRQYRNTVSSWATFTLWRTKESKAFWVDGRTPPQASQRPWSEQPTGTPWGNTARSVEGGNLPVGLFPVARFQSTRVQLNAGDRLLLVTDGVTETENTEGEFFGTERLEACGCEGFAAIERAVTEFRGSMPLNDDCTITEVVYCD